jgi:hypothetical protein
MDYNLDTNAAKAADNITSRIDAAGKYLGTITRAEPITSKGGAQGVDISFKSDTGATADYLTIWTHGKDGKQLSGFNLLMAIMTCLRVKSLRAEPAEIEKWDADQGKRVKAVAPVFRELMGKPVGVLIHMEEYEKRTGDTAWKPVISAAFDTGEFTASEILSKAKAPETLGKLVAGLRNRPLKTGGGKQQYASENPGAGMPASFDDLGDDIPW